MGKRLKVGTAVWIFVWCIFMGITVGSIGIGALFPSVNRITKPFVCNDGQLELVTQDYHPSPVETDTTLTWYCTNAATGARQEVSIFKMALIAGPLYGLVLFCIVMEVLWIRENRRSDPSTSTSHPLTEGDHSFASAGNLPSVEERLAELKRLRDAGLITEQDYASKKSGILRDL